MSKLVLVNGFCPHWKKCENAMTLTCYEATTDDCFEQKNDQSKGSQNMDIAPNGTQFLSMNECKDGYLYRINARNARLGIYKQKEMAFTISREKFTSNFLFDEYHWNIGTVLPEMTQFGTVFPLKEIEKAPEFKDDKEKLNYLNQKWEELKSRCSSVDRAADL